MTRDCFGNPTPGIPPSISDSFHDIARYRHVPLALRMEYHYARVDALIGRASPDHAWSLLRRINSEARTAAFSASHGAE